MIMKPEFYNLVNRMGLEDHELDLAFSVWSAAERAVQGKPSQVASLLEPVKPKKVKTKAPELDTAELMIQKHVNATFLRLLEDCLQHDRIYANTLWLKCDKIDPETTDEFKLMNKLRDDIRGTRKFMNKLAGIQRKLKKQLSN